MSLSFLVASIGGMILAFSKTHEYMLFGLLITRLGIDCSYCLIYVLTMEKFPSSISARLFGIFTLSASVSTIMSPIIAEMDDPLPLFLYIAICFLSMISSLTLDKY
jgi:MFS family permease